MRVLARCYSRILVETAPGRIATVELADVKTKGERSSMRVTDGLTAEDGVAVESDTATIFPSGCDGCHNFGPQGTPPGTAGVFQQFALQHGAYPWSGHRPGWYCMGCSFPPR